MQRLAFIVAALAAVMALPPVAFAGDKTPSTAERKFVGLLNQERAAQGLPTVEISPALTDVSDDYVAENVQQGAFTHDRDAPYTARASHAGCTGWDGPVMGQGYAGPAEVLQAWLDSPQHRVVILDPANTHIGVGFKGEHAVAYALHCTKAKNTSGDFGDPAALDSKPFVPPDVGAVDSNGSLRLASARTKAQGRTISTLVHIRAGQGTLSLVARSGRLVVRGKRITVAKRARAYRLAVRVSRPGRWNVQLHVNGRSARRFSVRVPAPR